MSDEAVVVFASLDRTAEQGQIPPWVTRPDNEHGWVFCDQLTAKQVEEFTHSNVTWVPGLDQALAMITVGWVDDQLNQRSTRRDLFSWFRCAFPDPLEADTATLVGWVTHYVHSSDGRRPSPIEIAERYETVCGWYQMLTDLGIGHSNPHHATMITVIEADAGEATTKGVHRQEVAL